MVKNYLQAGYVGGIFTVRLQHVLERHEFPVKMEQANIVRPT